MKITYWPEQGEIEFGDDERPDIGSKKEAAIREVLADFGLAVKDESYIDESNFDLYLESHPTSVPNMELLTARLSEVLNEPVDIFTMVYIDHMRAVIPGFKLNPGDEILSLLRKHYGENSSISIEDH